MRHEAEMSNIAQGEAKCYISIEAECFISHIRSMRQGNALTIIKNFL